MSAQLQGFISLAFLIAIIVLFFVVSFLAKKDWEEHKNKKDKK